jgi:hypothetical protein
MAIQTVLKEFSITPNVTHTRRNSGIISERFEMSPVREINSTIPEQSQVETSLLTNEVEQENPISSVESITEEDAKTAQILTILTNRNLPFKLGEIGRYTETSWISPRYIQSQNWKKSLEGIIWKKVSLS